MRKAELCCRVKDRAGPLQWTRDGFGLGDTRQLPGFSRYSLPASSDLSECSASWYCGA